MSDPIEGFTCTRKIELLETWVDREDPDSCHPCLIPPLASYYLGVLQEAGAMAQSKELEQVYSLDSANKVLTIAKTLDKIKSEVGDDLKKKLMTLDCFAQSYKDKETD